VRVPKARDRQTRFTHEQNEKNIKVLAKSIHVVASGRAPECGTPGSHAAFHSGGRKTKRNDSKRKSRNAAQASASKLWLQ
jgi:hypothetical protein